ncbi:aspartate aminotransferase family protein [Teredinibacter turnerae]|uniref:aspartate aminotransferase family protein n=1 Tax=Teredinibacter turnerae TaxID=2426 RepID=UPI00035E81C0|nr:aspartate aminotransferase family protein [Teredinibacter turnerae]
MSIFEQRESAIRAYSRVYPVTFASATNARQTDTDGREYIDFFAGAGVLNFGHNNPLMKSAVIDYLQRDGVVHSLDMQTQAKADFIETFTKTILEPRDMPYRLQFTGPTGTNAVEAAMKLARRVTGRNTIVAFQQAFHGMTLGALAATANPYFRSAAGVPLEHVCHEPFCVDAAEVEQNISALRDRYSTSPEHAPAAFMVETIQAEGGVNIAEKSWLEQLAKLAAELGALFIVDDIQVGCGRTGSYFSFDDIDIVPDIICLAKGVGGMGTPLAFNLVRPECDERWSPGEHTGTFRGQNLSFIAGKVGLEYFADDELMQAVADKTTLMKEMLEPLLAEDSSVSLRGKGMIMGLDFGDGTRAGSVVKQCFEKGLIVASCGIGGSVIKLIPPLTIPNEDLIAGLNILCEAARTVMEEAA